jgi:UDP-N-acetylmuramyl pentapeptide phosphotransferase/UDP-N-acetylglucosamine-1-phosphate transferase
MDGWWQTFDPRGWGFLAGGLAVSALVTWLGIGYAHRRNLIDHPGQRRSHSVPTPRGGGIGIVVAALLIFAVETVWLPREALPDLLACMSAIVLVAAVGWIDDHRGLAARWRLVAHAVAAGLVLFALSFQPASIVPGAHGSLQMLLVGLAWLALVWSINLHNFMDGIDGILAFQALFVFAAFAALCAFAGAEADAWHLAALGAAVAAFVPFNFPRARVFMGDVGSGVLGLLIGASALRLLAVDEIDAASGVIACSAFVTDASCNLLSRMWRGRRWYSAHREHLYQWMVRAGMPHARVVGWYMGWNLAVVAPVLWLLNHDLHPAAPLGAAAAVLVYGVGVASWVFGKRWCLDKVKSRRHASA